VGEVDWEEVAEFVQVSYRFVVPKAGGPIEPTRA
jgi:hypothetical protein